jgi:hypothetical protein
MSEVHHRIILLNFSHKDAETIAKAGYNVERGFAGVGDQAAKWLSYHTPHPIYEYDILFYNSRMTDRLEKEFSQERNAFQDRGFRNAMSSFSTPPRVRVSFIGEDTGLDHLFHGGVPWAKLLDADQNISVSSLLEVGKNNSWRIPNLHGVLTKLKGQISSVGSFYSVQDEGGWWNVPVLVTRDGHWVMGYAVTYGEQATPRYIVLPQMERPAEAIIEILRCLEELAPALFPDKRRTGWLETDEFSLPEELAINDAIAQTVEDAKAFIAAKQQEKKTVADKNFFVRALLVAKEDPALPPDRKLSGVVRSALEFLGFDVEDIDQKIRNAIKKEDFWVSDGGFLAITEVTGTVNKNPKIKEFNDILGRMATLYKRQGELVLPTGKDIVGLLVLNHDIENHPSNRPIPYVGAEAHIVDAAVEQGIGILSTVELHRIVMAVKKGSLGKEAARELIKRAGRIEYVRDSSIESPAPSESRQLSG